MSTLPNTQIVDLYRRALEERHHLHDRATELKSKIVATRESLSVESQTREHFGPAALIVAALGLLSGYVCGGAFTTR